MDAKKVISDILQLRFATFFTTEHGGDMGADVVLNALNKAGFYVTNANGTIQDTKTLYDK